MYSLQQERGLTLVEILTAVVIAGIMASLVAPSLLGIVGRAERHAAMNRIAGDLFHARMLAVRRGEGVMVRFDSAQDREFTGRYRILPADSARALHSVDLQLRRGQLKMGNERSPLGLQLARAVGRRLQPKDLDRA